MIEQEGSMKYDLIIRLYALIQFFVDTYTVIDGLAA